jgi:hypothetical protein
MFIIRKPSCVIWFLSFSSFVVVCCSHRSENHNRTPDYLKAIDLMCSIASTPNDLQLENRIECIEKALTSAELAYNNLMASSSSSSSSSSSFGGSLFSSPVPSRGNNGSAVVMKPGTNQSMESYLLDSIQQFKDMITIARKHVLFLLFLPFSSLFFSFFANLLFFPFLFFSGFQQRVSSDLENDYHSYHLSNKAIANTYDEKTLKGLENIKETISKLQYSLLNITSLYEISYRYHLWNYNLLILQLSKQGNNEIELITKLWKSFIYR